MKIIGTTATYTKNDTVFLPIIIECTGLEVKARSGENYDIDLNDCSIMLHTAHPSFSYRIIKTEQYDDGTTYKPYLGLSNTDVETIMKCAAESDIIDLRKLGNYQICCERELQSVVVVNEFDDFAGSDMPLLVKFVDDKEE